MNNTISRWEIRVCQYKQKLLNTRSDTHTRARWKRLTWKFTAIFPILIVYSSISVLMEIKKKSTEREVQLKSYLISMPIQLNCKWNRFLESVYTYTSAYHSTAHKIAIPFTALTYRLTKKNLVNSCIKKQHHNNNRTAKCILKKRSFHQVDDANFNTKSNCVNLM